jgi:hypothetical protein
MDKLDKNRGKISKLTITALGLILFAPANGEIYAATTAKASVKIKKTTDTRAVIQKEMSH